MKRLIQNCVLIILLFVLVSINDKQVFSDNARKIRVEQISPTLQGDSLIVSAHFVNIFSSKIVGTLQSGLPSLLQIELKVVESDGSLIVRKFITKTIEYNIWQNRYKLVENDGVRFFAEFEDVKEAGCSVTKEQLISKQRIIPEKSYLVLIRVGITPISESFAAKFSHWLLNPNRLGLSLVSGKSPSIFRFNRLTSFFVNQKGCPKYTSGWFSSKKFCFVESNKLTREKQ